MLLPDGTPGRLQRSLVLGLVCDIPTQRQARALLDQQLRSINEGRHQPQSLIPFSTFVDGDWTNLVVPTLKLSTQRGYRMVVRRHLLPYFGQQRLKDICKLDVQQFVAEKFRQKLAWQTVRNAWIVVSSILDAAVEYQYLAENPARGVKFPPPAPSRQPKILNAEEFTKLLGELAEPFKTMVSLVALTGLRIGELLALRWQAIDLEVRTLVVSESVFQGHVQTPKTRKSVRTIPLGRVACSLLDRHRRSLIIHPDATALLFANSRGGAYRESNVLQRVLQPAGEAAGLGRVTWHQFRHIHSSLLHDLGVPAKVAQQQLGHASVETTLRIYTHAIPETHRRAIDDLEGVLFPSVPKFGQGGRKDVA